MKNKRLLVFMSSLIVLVTISAQQNSDVPLGRSVIMKKGLPKSVPPLLSTHWSQNNGENCLLPYLDESHQTHVNTGCGATAMAQVMKYWNYPKHGIGSNYYYWQEVENEEKTLFADFKNTYYDWDNMVDIYKGNKNVTEKQLNAVGTLMLHIAVALQMKLNNTSPTQIEYIHTALKCFFGYNPQMRLLRTINGAYSMEEWLAIIYEELAEGRPIIMGGRYEGIRGKADHIYVADGYDENGRVHLNLGKAITYPGFNGDDYYDLTVTGETYNENMRMIIGISPENMETEVTHVHVATAGTLKEQMGGELESTKICRLKVTGEINDTDIAWLNRLTRITVGQLSYIDLSDCSIEGGKIPENAFDYLSQCYTLQEIILPDNLIEFGEAAFSECSGLYKIHIPNNLEVLKRYSISNCRYLRSISLPHSLRVIDNNPFAQDKLDQLVFENGNDYFKVVDGALFKKDGSLLICAPLNRGGRYTIPNGTVRIGARALEGCDYIDQLVIPSSVESVAADAFDCMNLQHVYSYALEPRIDVTALRAAFGGTLHVPVGCIDAYTAKGWDRFAHIIDDLPNEAIVLGDVNGDGEVNVTDVALIVENIMGQHNSSFMAANADVNGDGSITVTDVAGVVNIILDGNDGNKGGIGDTSNAYISCPNDNHPHMIDLGLPSGTKWACCNVDDNHSYQKPTNFGSYYAWGEVKGGKDYYYWNTYTHCDGSSSTCHDLGKDIAGTKYDVAHVQWGGSWVMPSYDQILELLENCTYTWTSKNGVNGCQFSGPSGGSIFLPAAGYRNNESLNNAGSYGNYWSSTQFSSYSDNAYDLYFYSGFAYWDYLYRSYGHTVRPVSR